MRLIQSNKDALAWFDPSFVHSVLYHPVSREAVEHKFFTLGLRHRKRLFSDGIMDALFERLDQFASRFDPEKYAHISWEEESMNLHDTESGRKEGESMNLHTESARKEEDSMDLHTYFLISEKGGQVNEPSH